MLDVNNIFYQITIILILSTLFGSVALYLKQPLIIAFIGVGIVIGPAGLEWVSASEEVELFAQLGIALLLFVVGLKLDIHEIRSVGPVALITGIGQIILTGLIGYFLAKFFNFNFVESFYIAVSLAFSSTIIIIKLLSDKKEIDALHSRISVGILIIQDIVVVLVMIGLTAWQGHGNGGGWVMISLTVLTKGVMFLGFIALATRYLLPRILQHLAQSVELLILFSITWAIALAAMGDALGFSQEVGSFLAGISLASTSYRAIIGARLVSLRDFLLLFFFINLGIHIDVTHLGSEIIPAIMFSLFVLLGKPLMIMSLMGLMGYRKYTSAITSLSLSQISEFSLILATLGLSLGHISEEVMGLITLVGLITMGISTYMIIYSQDIYQWLVPVLGNFERKITHVEDKLGDLSQFKETKIDVILFGLGRYGGCLIQYLNEEGLVVLGVDFNPEMVKLRRKQGIFTLYGDAEEPEFAKMLPLSQALWVVSTIPGEHLSLNLLRTLKEHHFEGQIALTTHTAENVNKLNQAGADLVLLPFRDAAKEAAYYLKNLMIQEN